MFSTLILCVVCVLITVVASQTPNVTCKIENDFQIIFSSYNYRSKYRCTFENVNSADDFRNLKFKVSSPDTVSTIIFVNSSLSSLPEKIFYKFGLLNARKLDGSRLVLKEIDSLAFNTLKTWDSIDLSSNQVTKLSDNTFAGMQIRFLDLSLNYIETIEANAFADAEVTKLAMSHNKIKSISFINSLLNFNTLELNSNLFETLDKIDMKGSKDTTFTSRRIVMEVDPPKIFLQNNKLKRIDCESATKIGGLNLEENFDLKEISLNDCQLDAIDVSNCGTIKVKINDNLKSFTAKNTKISEMNFDTVNSLNTVSFENSSITDEILEQVLKLENLTYLDLSHNNLGPLKISTFAKLKNLQFLFLKATNISNIEFGTFSHQQQLKQFDISENHLSFFDMNMIFSMSSLLVLDVSGNDLRSLENFETSHFMFTLLTKIDLSGNKWPCSYLMRMIKVFRTYRVALARSNLEETNTNLHGIACEHVDGEDVVGVLDAASNVTDIREKMNEIIKEMGKNSQFKADTEARLRQMEKRIDNQVEKVSVTSAALKAEKTDKIQVQNSALLELSLTVVCICFTVFMTLQIFNYVKRNFLGRPKPMRTTSENTLTMNVDYD